ncbi:sensor histidine kinase [Amycolatopsis lurida]
MNDLLRTLWAEPSPPHPPRRVWRDWALVAVLLPAAVLEGIFRPDLPSRLVSAIIVAGLVPTLLWRRTRPLPMLAIAFGISALASLVIQDQLQNYTVVYLLLLPYALVRWGSGREVVVGSAIVLANVGLSAALGTLGREDAIGGAAILFAIVALGAAFRYRGRARQRELDQAKLLEREHLARDLHDTVAHHVSAMAIRAQAGLATMRTRPDAAAEALRLIESEASSALEEMRAMVRVLRRNEPAELTPSPGVRALEQLATTRGGPAVDVGIDGDVGDLPPSVGAAIYRLAQESVTNARRHARHATRIEVRVTADETSVRLRVSDDGDVSAGKATPGYGLIGMIERAGLLGGTCEAGPNPGRGWTVAAVLPRTGSAG